MHRVRVQDLDRARALAQARPVPRPTLLPTYPPIHLPTCAPIPLLCKC
jgi:hypothetical protein